MYHTRNIKVVLTSCCALFLFFTLTTICAAQTTGKIADTTGHLQSALNYKGNGWLILNGEYIPGPYEVTITDSTVLVNDLIALSKPEPGEKRVVDSSTTAQHTLLNELSDSFHVWIDAVGVDTARQKCLRFMQKQSSVADAYIKNGERLRFTFKNEKYEEGMWLKPAKTPSVEREARLRGNLQAYGKRLQSRLNSGSLVILQGGRYRDVLYPRSKTVFKQLKEIATDVPDREDRVSAILEIIRRRSLAETIADKFFQN